MKEIKKKKKKTEKVFFMEVMEIKFMKEIGKWMQLKEKEHYTMIMEDMKDI